MSRVILDTDIGICNDDCQALLLIFNSPEIALDGICVSAGNLTMKQSLYNALSLIEYLGRPGVKVYPGEELPLKHSYGEFERASYGQWGEKGDPVWPFGYEPSISAQPVKASKWLLDNVTASPGEVDILALGPLTNIAAALSIDSRAGSSIRSLTCMGGLFPEVSATQGNITPTAEFNFWVDPDAANIVLASSIPVRIIPLNLTRQMLLPPEVFIAMAMQETRVGRLYATVLEALDKNRMPANFDASDTLVVASHLWPELFEFKLYGVEVNANASGDYGASKLLQNGGEREVEVAVGFDAEAVKARIFERFGIRTAASAVR